MRNIRLRLQYEGTRYQGWQKQTSTDNTIQGKMEVLLTKMCGEPVEIAASGRTDAGVHALGQVANFHTESDMSTEEIMAYCNRYLPEDIAVVEVSEAAPRFHSRLNATGKRYRYRIINSQIPDVFWRRYATEEPEELDLNAMRKAAELLLGEHDFKAFTSAKKSKKSTVRRIDEKQTGLRRDPDYSVGVAVEFLCRAGTVVAVRQFECTEDMSGPVTLKKSVTKRQDIDIVLRLDDV